MGSMVWNEKLIVVRFRRGVAVSSPDSGESSYRKQTRTIIYFRFRVGLLLYPRSSHLCPAGLSSTSASPHATL